jgi:hypothetical protein
MIHPRGQFRTRVSAAFALLVPFLVASELRAQTIDHSAGFASNGDLTPVGSTVFGPAGASSAARLTPATGGQAGSFWATSKVDVTLFTNTFTFQFTNGSNPIADGITFTIQNASGTALGASGGSMGYAGITPSVSFTMKTYDGTSSPAGYSTVISNGAVPPTSSTVAPLSYPSGHVFRADMTYDGTTLQVQLTDTSTNQSVSQGFPINIPTTVGASTAWVGFTGGTGGAYADQDVLTWVWTTISTPAAPTGVTATPATPPPFGYVDVTWNASTGAASYTISRSTSASGPFTVVGTSTTTSFLDAGTLPGTTYYYVVSATNIAGTSPDSAPPAQVTTNVHPPRTGSDKKTGCGCGVTGANPAALWVWGSSLLVLALLLARGR